MRLFAEVVLAFGAIGGAAIALAFIWILIWQGVAAWQHRNDRNDG